MSTESSKKIPAHIGLILDGNRRWAKARMLPSLKGHSKGTENIREVIERAMDLGVSYISLFVFSTENWKRTEEEVGHLMGLFLRMFKRDRDELVAQGVRVQFAGQLDDPSIKPSIKKAIADLETATADNTRGTVVFCFNYGGQTEIIDATKRLVASGVQADDITQEMFEQNLYTPNVPNLDLVVRTSGENRLSGFQLWRAAYAEFLFVDKHWPDFTADDMTAAVEEFQERDRRIGK